MSCWTFVLQYFQQEKEGRQIARKRLELKPFLNIMDEEKKEEEETTDEEATDTEEEETADTEEEETEEEDAV